MSQIALDLPRWPAELSGLRVGVLSDLHAGAPHVPVAQVTRLVERMNAEAPDLVVLLGDYASHRVLGGKRVAPGPVAGASARCTAPLGVLRGARQPRLVGARPAHGGRPQRRRASRVLENEAVRAGDLWVADSPTCASASPRSAAPSTRSPTASR